MLVIYKFCAAKTTATTVERNGKKSSKLNCETQKDSIIAYYKFSHLQFYKCFSFVRASVHGIKAAEKAEGVVVSAKEVKFCH